MKSEAVKEVSPSIVIKKKVLINSTSMESASSSTRFSQIPTTSRKSEPQINLKKAKTPVSTKPSVPNLPSFKKNVSTNTSSWGSVTP